MFCGRVDCDVGVAPGSATNTPNSLVSRPLLSSPHSCLLSLPRNGAVAEVNSAISGCPLRRRDMKSSGLTTTKTKTPCLSAPPREDPCSDKEPWEARFAPSHHARPQDYRGASSVSASSPFVISPLPRKHHHGSTQPIHRSGQGFVETRAVTAPIVHLLHRGCVPRGYYPLPGGNPCMILAGTCPP